MSYLTKNLETSLELISAYTGFPLRIEDALADTIGGYHSDPAKSQWMIGSQWAVEGQTLYALVRAMRPTDVIELGTHIGCSTSHLALGLINNGQGRLRTVDIDPAAGSQIVATPITCVERINASGPEYLEAQPDSSVDLIYNDMPQAPAVTRQIIQAARRVLRPGGVLVTHDYCHFIVGVEIQQGYASAGIEPLGILTPPSDCGLAFWKQAGVFEQTVIEAEAVVTEEAPKPKRARKSKVVTE